jgi:hypothetical protein
MPCCPASTPQAFYAIEKKQRSSSAEAPQGSGSALCSLALRIQMHACSECSLWSSPHQPRNHETTRPISSVKYLLDHESREITRDGARRKTATSHGSLDGAPSDATNPSTAQPHAGRKPFCMAVMIGTQEGPVVNLSTPHGQAHKIPRWFSKAAQSRPSAAAPDNGYSDSARQSSTSYSGSTLPCAIAPQMKTFGRSVGNVGTSL